MRCVNIGTPNDKQRRFFLSTARYTGYGGARGGGKSWALRSKLALMSFTYPSLRALLLRKTMPELRENHILPLQALLGDAARYNQSERAFKFPNGSRLKLGYCDKEKDIYQYQGQEYDVIAIDECTHFTWEQVQFLTTCNRNTRADLHPRMYFTGNPGGVGHQWFRRLFVKGEYEDGERAEDYAFIPATVDDNVVLMERNPEYVQALEALPEKLRRAHRFGDWDVFEGQFFEEFRDIPAHYADRRWTHVIAPFDPPRDWPVYRSFDYGYAKPFSMGWWTVDYDGRLYRILELYGCTNTPNEGVKWDVDQIFREAAQIEREHRYLAGREILGVADPAIWDPSRGLSIAEQAARQGILFSKGKNGRMNGWAQVHRRLAFDSEGVPMLQAFSTCRAFVRTMPLLQYSSTRAEDLDTDGEDHVADEVRYMCMMRPIEPRRLEKAEPVAYNPLDDNVRPSRYDFYRM